MSSHEKLVTPTLRTPRRCANSGPNAGMSNTTRLTGARGGGDVAKEDVQEDEAVGVRVGEGEVGGDKVEVEEEEVEVELVGAFVKVRAGVSKEEEEDDDDEDDDDDDDGVAGESSEVRRCRRRSQFSRDQKR
jgi:hypothetical protein